MSEDERKTYQGPNIIRNGVSYTWSGTEYLVTTSLPTSTQDELGLFREVLIPFTFVQQTSSFQIPPNEVKVFVDGEEWTEPNVKYGETTISILFQESYIASQRVIEFTTEKYETDYAYVVRSRVYEDNDVVVGEFIKGQPVPILGSVTDLTTPTGRAEAIERYSPAGGVQSGGNVSAVNLQPAMGATQNFESLNPIQEFDRVDATIEQVVGPVYE